MNADTDAVGEGVIRRMLAAASERHFKNVLVLHGRAFAAALSAIQHDIDIQNLICISNIPSNPDIDFIASLSTTLPLRQLDLIVAIGGGSVIDTSKLLLAIAMGTSAFDLLRNEIRGKDRPLFWVAPTTAGSGSEATHFAVAYQNGRKYSVAHDTLLPDWTVLDASLTITCPPSVTIASGVDAFCQSIESFWSPKATDTSRSYALSALQIIPDNLTLVLTTPAHHAARQNLLRAANLAGKAINITKTTAGHALSYGLTAELGIPHGIAVLLVMGPLIQLMAQKYGFFRDSSAALDKVLMPWGSDFVAGFMAFQKCMLDAYRRVLGEMRFNISGTQMMRLMEQVNIERLKNHPVALTSSDIANIYAAIFETRERL
ncbi:MAG: iron-containing alcohol dehydrogenase [Deltaproteobacteria bacterium]|nr:iron-containing alcohol dehydrogenase [Deltaproteobacteria bacterium]